ncbi:MAG: hypothetical protein QXP91_13155, partial [Candidatus Methanomethylicia archaeon]
FQSTNIVEVKLIKLKFGGAVSGTILNIKTLCENITVKQLGFESGQLTINAELQINNNPYSKTISLNNLNINYPTVVTVIVSEVEVYMLGG